MYEELFHSPDRPFRATPDIKFYYPHESIEAARQTVVRATLRAEGPVMVLGGAGLGKSLLSLVVIADLAARFDTIKLHAARLCSRRALLQNILFELQLPYRNLSEGELRLSILDRLEPASEHAPEGLLVVVDEAHTLPVKLLDELRLITNFTRNNQPRARLVLIGNLRLEDTFADPQMESFNQRLAARCYLQPMNRLQTREYVRHQLTAGGVVPSEFITEEALDTVYAASEGVPRLANQIMDHALVLAVTRSQCPLSSALIEEAWADLQQLPAPWHSGAEPTNVSSHSTVEFGSLDDSDEVDTVDEAPEVHAFEFASPVKNQSLNQAPKASQAACESCENELCTNGECQSLSSGPESVSSADAELEHDEDAELQLLIDCNDDLQLLVEDETELALDTEAARESNFFAAFQQPDYELDDVQAANESAHQRVELVRPRVVFDASQAFSSQGERPRWEQPSEGMGSDRFFANRPTDEQLLALEDEQAQYDSMGVWENDPPLATATDLNTAEQGPLESPNRGPGQCTSVSNLFGDDFEEEIPISTELSLRSSLPAEVLGRQGQHFESIACAAPVASSAASSMDEEQLRQACETADYIARLQEYADAVSASQSRNDPMWTVDEVLASEASSAAKAAAGDSASEHASWSVDVASLDVENEVAVQSEIEDMVSQLNFAAFSVEPYSVEQISLEVRDNRTAPVSDSVRTGANSEIYTLHRAQVSEESLFSNMAAGYDDDRDLLIIEEDVPVSPKAADTTQADKPVTKIAPYSQLFAKLRK